MCGAWQKMCRQSKVYKTVYEWVNAIIFATVVATLVHIFLFQMYVIPPRRWNGRCWWATISM